MFFFSIFSLIALVACCCPLACFSCSPLVNLFLWKLLYSLFKVIILKESVWLMLDCLYLVVLSVWVQQWFAWNVILQWSVHVMVTLVLFLSDGSCCHTTAPEIAALLGLLIFSLVQVSNLSLYWSMSLHYMYKRRSRFRFHFSCGVA